MRVPYPGYDMNSVSYKAEGMSNFDALQLQVHKRLSNGLQFTGSYTWSHSLDEQSGLGLFFTGNNPLTPKRIMPASDFDQTHVFLINYSYTIPNFVDAKRLGDAINGWTIGGQTVAQSGQPYSVYDYFRFGREPILRYQRLYGNPIVPLVPGVTAKQAEWQVFAPWVNCRIRRVCKLNAADFAPQFVAPGTNGVPACDASGCDNFESCLELRAGIVFAAHSKCVSTPAWPRRSRSKNATSLASKPMRSIFSTIPISTLQTTT